jgi:hypothetical protein
MYVRIAAMCVAFGCFGARAVADEPAPGGMKLLPGYEHTKRRGIDTEVGRIAKKDGLTIEYDIGGLAGNYAKNAAKNKPLWSRQQTVGKQKFDVCLDKERTLYVTVDGFANFYAKVKSDEDIADVLLMALTYGQPAERK